VGKVNSAASTSANVKSSSESRHSVVAELGPFLRSEVLLPVVVLGKVDILVLGQGLRVAQDVLIEAVQSDLGGIALQLAKVLGARL